MFIALMATGLLVRQAFARGGYRFRRAADDASEQFVQTVCTASKEGGAARGTRTPTLLATVPKTVASTNSAIAACLEAL